MDIHVSPALVEKLSGLAAATGRTPDQIVEDALTAYLEELAAARDTLDSRYDELKTGRVEPIDAEAAWSRLRRKSERRRSGVTERCNATGA
jgi:predicted transcriptional regulator